MNKKIVFALSAVALLIAIAIYFQIPRDRAFDSMAEFSEAWASSSHENRPEMLRWLLNAEPARHTTYQIELTRLNGMRQAEIEALMPLGQYDQSWGKGGVSYQLGSIEPDYLGFIVPKQDFLMIDFDDEGVIKRIETGS